MSSETPSDNDTTCKTYHNQQQQQYVTSTMLNHQSIEPVPVTCYENTTPIHSNFALQLSLPSSPAVAASCGKNNHIKMKRSHDFNMTEEEKRQQTLEKNRLAASKCRQRKKAWVEELTKKSDLAMYQNASLKRVIAQLKEEVLFLKGQLLAHRGCECQIINNYIKLHMIDNVQYFESVQSPSLDRRLVISPLKNPFR